MKTMFRILHNYLGPRHIFRPLIAYALLMFVVTAAKAQSIQEGQALFGTKCYNCHNIGGGDKTGPDLKGVTSRRTKEWLHEFVNGPASMNARGDAAAKQLFAKFGSTVMPDQGLTNQQIDSLMMLIDDLTKANQ